MSTYPNTHKDIWDRWIALWNGDLTVADDLLADELRVNSPKLSPAVDPSQIRDRAGAVALIGGVQAMARLRYETVVGPIGDGDHVTGGWAFTGTYNGGMPGATAAPGTPLANTGIDILRIEQGRVVEWWSAAENLTLLATLGLIHVG